MQIFPKFCKRRCLAQLPPSAGSPPCDRANTPDYNRLSAVLQAYHQLHPPVWRLISMSGGCADNHHFPPPERRAVVAPRGGSSAVPLKPVFTSRLCCCHNIFSSLSPERPTCETRRQVTQGVAQTTAAAAVAAAMSDLIHNHPLRVSMSLIKLAY